MLYQFPKTAEELIELLEKVQKNSQADEFFKKIFQQDPVESENKFLYETVNNLQLRIAEFERKYDTLHRINRSLAFDLTAKTEELKQFKKTVISKFDALPEDHFSTEVPSFLKIVQAEQALHPLYATEDKLVDQRLSNLHYIFV